jgi:hypothetical protein
LKKVALNSLNHFSDPYCSTITIESVERCDAVVSRKMTKIEIAEGDLAEAPYGTGSDEDSEKRVGKLNITKWAWSKVRSKRVTQFLGVTIISALILWTAYIIAANKKIDSVDVITFELTITVIICLAIAAHLNHSSSR